MRPHQPRLSLRQRLCNFFKRFIITDKVKTYFIQPRRIYQFALAVFVILFYVFSRLWMIVKYGDAAFGYDFGIYRHYVGQYFDRLGDPTVVPFGWSNFSNVLRLLGSSVDQILFGWYFLFSVLILAALYSVVKNHFNAKTAIISIALFAASITQFEFYQWYFYRNFLALFFVLLAFLFIYYQSYFLILPLVFIGIVHPLSLIPLGLSLFVYLFVCEREKRKFLLISGAVSLVLILLLNWRELRIYLPFFTEYFGSARKVAESGHGEFNGLFINTKFYLSAAILYWPVGTIGFILLFKKYKLFAIFLAVNIILMSVGFVLHQRFFVFLDLAIIIFASAALSVETHCNASLHPWRRRLTPYFVAVFCVLLFVLSSWHIVHKKPLITQAEMNSIQTLSHLPDGEYALAISSNYAPWLLGYANKKIIAPGMFEYDKFSREEWQKFWFSNDASVRYSLLARYNSSPIYLFLGDRGLSFISQINKDTHFTKLSKYLWRFDL